MAEKTTNKPFEGKIPEDFRKHTRAAREEFRKGVESLFPPEFATHRRQARKEMLLAWRSLIDASLEHIEETGKKV